MSNSRYASKHATTGNLLLRAMPQPAHQQGASAMPSYLGLADDDDGNADTVLNRTKTVLRYHLQFLLMEVATYHRLPLRFDANNLPKPPTVPRRLHISNLPYSSTEQDLRELAKKFGNVVHCNIATNERGSCGYGFVSFETEQQTQVAKKNLPLMCFSATENRPLVVNEASLKPYRWRMVWIKFVANVHKTFGCHDGSKRVMRGPTQEELDTVINYSASVPQHHLRHEHMTEELQEHMRLAKQHSQRYHGGARLKTESNSSSSSGSSTESKCIGVEYVRGGDGVVDVAGHSGGSANMALSRQTENFYNGPSAEPHGRHTSRGVGGGEYSHMGQYQPQRGSGNLIVSHGGMQQRSEYRQQPFEQQVYETASGSGTATQHSYLQQPARASYQQKWASGFNNGNGSPVSATAEVSPFPVGTYNRVTMPQARNGNYNNNTGSSTSSPTSAGYAASLGGPNTAIIVNGSTRTSPGCGTDLVSYNNGFFSTPHDAHVKKGQQQQQNGTAAMSASPQAYGAGHQQDFEFNFGTSRGAGSAASGWNDFNMMDISTQDTVRALLASPTFGAMMNRELTLQSEQQPLAGLVNGNGNTSPKNNNTSQQCIQGVERKSGEVVDTFTNNMMHLNGGGQDLATGAASGVSNGVEVGNNSNNRNTGNVSVMERMPTMFRL